MFFTEVEKLGVWSQGKRIGSETIKFFIHTRLPNLPFACSHNLLKMSEVPFWA
jgi:hypothetical protein